MIARAAAVIEPGGVLGELACAPPLTLRQVLGEAGDRCELCLVGTAAGPLPGDDLSISLRLRAGARATLRRPAPAWRRAGATRTTARTRTIPATRILRITGTMTAWRRCRSARTSPTEPT